MQAIGDVYLLLGMAISALQLDSKGISAVATVLDEAVFPKVKPGAPSVLDKPPACYVQPQWNVCKYTIIKWQREYRWRAYYDQDSNECYYFRGCPDTNKDLFDYDVECRDVCVHGKKQKLQGKRQCRMTPKVGKKGCKTKLKR